MNAATEAFRYLSYYDKPLDNFGWTLVIGYTVLDWGRKGSSWVDKHGEWDHDSGDGAEVQLVSFELLTPGARISVEPEAFTMEQLGELEAEIVGEVETMREER